MSILETAIQSFVTRKLGQPAAQSTAKNATPHSEIQARSLPKALLAGAIAGAAATAAKTLAEKVYPPRTQGEPEPTAVLADKALGKVAGHALAKTDKLIAMESIHWTFGIVVGAAYGAIAEYYPMATSRDGASFGMTLMALTHESALPVLGLSPAPAAQTPREKTSEMVTHVVYGVVTETVRRTVRKMPLTHTGHPPKIRGHLDRSHRRSHRL